MSTIFSVENRLKRTKLNTLSSITQARGNFITGMQTLQAAPLKMCILALTIGLFWVRDITPSSSETDCSYVNKLVRVFPFLHHVVVRNVLVRVGAIRKQ